MQSHTPNSDITAAARTSLSGNWGKAITALFIYGFIQIGLGLSDSVLCGLFLSPESSLKLAQWVFSGALLVGQASFFISLTNGIPEIPRLFDGFNRFGRSFATSFMCGLFVFLWSLLFLIPGIIKSYSYAMTFFILADDPDAGVLEAITRSRKLMDGNKFKFWLLSWRFFGWAILCMFTMGIGFIWLAPYAQTSMTEFYKDIK